MDRTYEFLDLRDGSYLVGVAYPVELFEEGNMPVFLASTAGDVFGMRKVTWLMVGDIYLPRRFLEHFKGPLKGLGASGEIFEVYDRP